MIRLDLKIRPEGLERIRKMPDLMVPAVHRGLKSGMIEAEARAKEPYLSGLALRVRTGHLRRSVTSGAAIEGDKVTGWIGTNVVYGRFWELGFTGIEQVKAHARRIKTRDLWSGEGKGKRQAASGLAFVRAHARHVSIKPRPFLRPAILDRLGIIAVKMGEEIERAFSAGGNAP